LISFVKLI